MSRGVRAAGPGSSKRAPALPQPASLCVRARAPAAARGAPLFPGGPCGPAHRSGPAPTSTPPRSRGAQPANQRPGHSLADHLPARTRPRRSPGRPLTAAAGQRPRQPPPARLHPSPARRPRLSRHRQGSASPFSPRPRLPSRPLLRRGPPSPNPCSFVARCFVAAPAAAHARRRASFDHFYMPSAPPRRQPPPALTRAAQ
jgi:hypothetical protein